MRYGIVVLLALICTSPAFAKHRYHHPFHGARYAHRGSGSLAGRPHAWCGWFARTLVGHDPGPSYNLARNWAHWGRATVAHIGAIVVWYHHVGKIVGGSPGAWQVLSGNDGHAVRTRVRSIAGAIAFRE